MPTRRIIVGVPWFERADYVRLRTLFTDRGFLPDSYDEWLENTGRTLQDIKARGELPVKVPIIPDEFIEWCRERGIRPYTNCLVKYAAFMGPRVLDG
jgi:hypothetical protein